MLKALNILLLTFFLITCKNIHDSVVENVNLMDSMEKKQFHLNECDKKGILTMVNIPDTVLNENTVQFLIENKIMGIILFNYNIQSEKQLKQLTQDLKNKVDKNILIAIDHEGGEVINIPWDKTRWITARMIGRSGSLQYAYNIAYHRAVLLRELGINVILGPVADVALSRKSYLYERCFGTTPEWVAAYVAITVKAQKDAGIISVLKHFPGHGKTITNSHFPGWRRNGYDRPYY
jgi:beta-N-acetylhexosaminidase